MIAFYLVTGFLGAGKTTFLRNFVQQMASKRLRLVVNEFGKVHVDGALLAEVDAKLEEINGGSIFCSCRLDSFEKVLEEILSDPPGAVIVEASGLSDPTSIRKVLEHPRFSPYDYRGAVCLVDAPRFHKVFATVRVCPKQLSVSDLVLVNKADTVPPEQVEETVRAIREWYPGAAVRPTVFGRIERDWLDCLGRNRSGDENPNSRDLTLQSHTVAIREGIARERLERILRMFAEDTYRIKGFVRLEEGFWLVDCVGAQIVLSPWQGNVPEICGELAVLAGKGMNPRKSIKQASAWYPGDIERID